MDTTIGLTTLSFNDRKTYFASIIFIIGNIVLPQLFHLIPQGGLIWLPIYFFTLVGAYMYGWRVGLLTAVASPLINSALFGMPAVAVLPVILIKSTVLALLAGFAAQYFRKVSQLLLAGVVLGYQVLGGVGEWALTGSFAAACQDFRLGLPGMALQVFVGWLLIKALRK